MGARAPIAAEGMDKVPLAGRRRPESPALCFLSILAAASGCGYIRVRVTPVAASPTATAPVWLGIPQVRATATSVPAPPLPTATPTATPTPVVHIVQKGENLLGIAEQYDVSVQALIEVNGIVDPRALQVGQELIIPYDTAALLTAQPTATPTPMPLRIVHEAMHRTPVGSLWCMGEVENERDEFLDLVQVQVSLYDAEGKLIEQAAAFTMTDVVPAHGKAPFAILIARAPASGFANYEIGILSAEPITYWGRRYRAIAVEEIASEMKPGDLVLRGAVHNQGEQDAVEVQVIVTAYGEGGEVVGVRQVALDDLAAGERLSFTADMVPAAPAVAVDAMAWAMKPAP
jgi:LysM repeat protein